jgi:hypothetical protein
MNLRALIIQLVITILLFVVALMLLRMRARLRLARNPANRNRKESPRPCGTVRPEIYRRPDPMIYDQRYLMKHGIAITWDNPDIQLELGGVAVPSESLTPSTTYDIVARIWNGSTTAPAVMMPVRYSYLTFGIGQKRVSIGETPVDLPVKGAPGCPAFARMKWTTPNLAGHYCLQAELIWSDDENPDNNLGQENTNVKPLNSPNATFTFPVRNDTAVGQRLLLEADIYAIPRRHPCAEPGRTEQRTADDEIARRERETQSLHDRGKHALPAGWRVEIQPNDFALAPDQEQQVTVDITAADGFSGRQGINIHAFDVLMDRAHPRLTGGVTLYVTG